MKVRAARSAKSKIDRFAMNYKDYCYQFDNSLFYHRIYENSPCGPTNHHCSSHASISELMRLSEWRQLSQALECDILQLH